MAVGVAGLTPYIAGPLLHPSGRWAPPVAVPLSSGAEAMVLMLADVSGFTALTRSLAHEGAVGGEKVGAALDLVIGGILDDVEALGGIPVASAGDSLLAMWPASVLDDLAVAARRARRCADMVCKRFAGGHVVHGVELGIHIGVAAGPAEVLHVGSNDRHVILVGPAVEAVGQAASKAGTGTVAQVEVAVPPTAVGGAGSWAPAPDQAVALQRYVPRALASRLIAGHEPWLADLRRVTVVFVGLPGLEHATAAGWHEMLGVIEEIVEPLEGEVHHVMVDDKGATLMVAFGLPPAAHEDDGRRAVTAAGRIEARLGWLGVAARIGVATGPVFSGPVGGASWRRYTVIGDAVNRAARLMALPGLVCDTATVEAAAELGFAFRGAVELKGFAEAVDVWAPTGGARDRTAVDSPMLLGREVEWAVLSDALRRAEQGAGGVVVLEGDAGLGKSRLVAQLATQVRAAGGDPLVVEGDAIETRVPYHPWWNAAGEASGGSATDAATRRGEVVATVAGRLMAGTGPRVLIAEDAHWFDSASWAVLAGLRAASDDVLLVLTTRPRSVLSGDEARLRADERATVVRLAPLGAGDVALLAAEVAGAGTVQPLLAERLAARAGGNPYFVKEVMRAFLDTGAVVVRDGAARFAPGAEGAVERVVPDRLDAVVVARLDRLGPTEQLTAKVASVIGQAFTYRAVMGVYPIESERAALGNALEELERASVTERQAVEGVYAFSHAITRDAAYSLLSGEQRRRLHAQIADWLEATEDSPNEPGRLAAVLAHHRDAAADFDAARRHYEVAGDHALSVGAYREASDAYGRLLELAALEGPAVREAERRRLAARLGTARLGYGDSVGALDDLTIALVETGVFPVDRPPPVLVARFLWEFTRLGLRQVRWTRRLGRRRSSPTAATREPRLSLAYQYVLCSSYTTASPFGPVPFVLARAANLAERSGHPLDLAEAYAYLAIAMGSTPLKALSRTYVRRAQTAADLASTWVGESGLSAIDADMAHGFASYGKAMSTIWSGRPAGALDAAAAAHDAMVRGGERRRAADTVCIGGFASLWCGDFARSDNVAQMLWDESALDENEQMQAYSAVARTLTALVTGRDEEAKRVSVALMSLDDSHVTDQERAFRIAVHAYVHWSESYNCADNAATDVSAALAEAARLMAAEKILTVPGRWQLYAILATVGLTGELETWARSGRPGGRAFATKVGLRGLRRYRRVLPVAAPGCFRLHAVDAFVHGRPRLAEHRLRKAERSADRLGMVHQKALVGLTRAELWAAAGAPVARDKLERSRDHLTELGAHGDARRAGLLLSQLPD